MKCLSSAIMIGAWDLFLFMREDVFTPIYGAHEYRGTSEVRIFFFGSVVAEFGIGAG